MCMNLKFKRILAIGAHPDDVEYSCMGFLMYQKENGSDVSVYVASNGSVGDKTSGPIRNEETRIAISSAQFSLHQGQYNNFDYSKIEDELRKIVLEKEIDCVLVHDPRDTHQEHRIIYEITMSAIRRLNISVIRYRSVSSSIDYVGNYFILIDKFIDKKFEILAFHKSQSDKPYMNKQSIKDFHNFYFPSNLQGIYYESLYIEKLLS